MYIKIYASVMQFQGSESLPKGKCSIITMMVVVLMLMARPVLATTFYSQGSLAPNNASSWNTSRTGGGSDPVDFLGGDTFVIQNGHSMATTALWSLSGAGNMIRVESGGILTATSTFIISTELFQIDDGGTYIHNAASNSNGDPADLPGSTSRVFGMNSTVEFQKWGDGAASNPVPLPAGITWGNLKINVSMLGGNWQQSGALTNIGGNLMIASTGGTTREFILFSNASDTSSFNLSGDLQITGGILNLSNGTAASILKIGKNYNQSGGTITAGTGYRQIIFTGAEPSVTFTRSSGTLSNTNINWLIDFGKTVGLNTNFGAGNWVNGSKTMTVNGTFKINQGSFPGNGGIWSYGTSGTLIYNNSSGSYGVGNDNYWPATNGPVNVSVIGSGGIQMNVNRSVPGVFQTSAGVTNGNNLTFTGTAQINAGGFFTGSPSYGSNSTLVYNTPAGYGVNAEWTGSGAGVGGNRSAGPGQPQNVNIQAGILTLNNSPRALPGNLNINAGGLTLTTGGDLAIGGNWNRLAGTSFSHNNVGIWFIGNSGTQSINTVGGATFGYLLIKGSGNLLLNSNVTVTGTTADPLQLLSGGLDLNGNTLTMSGGGNLKVDGTARTISGTGGGILAFTAATKINSSNSGSLVLASTVTARLTAGVNFLATTLNGILQLDGGGFVNTTPPVYGNASTLIYNNAAGYLVASEWNSTSSSSGSGVPKNVTVQQGNVTLPTAARTVPGGLTLNGGSITLNGADLTVSGPLSLGNGKIHTGSRKIISNGMVTRNSGYINGNLQKPVPTGASSLSFEIGDPSNYTPLTVTFGEVTVTGNLTATTAALGVPPASGSGLNQLRYVNRKWLITNAGVVFNNYSAVFNFVSGDLVGNPSTNLLIIGKKDGNSWTQPDIGIRTSTSTEATGMTSFSEFNLAEVGCSAIIAPTFTQLGPYCKNSVIPVSDSLKMISNNGFAGSWNPATINTSNAGQQTFTWTPNPGECASSVTMVITVFPRPSSVVGGGRAICSGNSLPNVSINLSGTAPWTFTYTNGTDTTAVTGVRNNPYVITEATAGIYSVISLGDSICTALPGDMTGSATVIVNAGTFNSSTQTACNSYNWHGIAYSASGTYLFSYNNGNGCPSMDTLHLTITVSSPVPGIITQPTCSINKGAVVLTGLPANGNWTIQPGAITGNGSFITIAGLWPGAYSFTVTDSGGCTSLASSNVVINTQPGTTASPVANVIQPTCTLGIGSIQVTSSTSGLSFSLDGSDYSNTTGIFTSIAPGTYNLTAKNPVGCTSRATLVTVNEPPPSVLTPSAVVTDLNCDLGTFRITVTSPTAGLRFSINGTDYSNTTGVFNGVQQGTYSLTAKNAVGCISPAFQIIF